jgi:glycosyltransferase involved in cell wall biosynthesis
VVVPSLFPETFGLVALEAFAVRTPVIVHKGGGALVEVGVESGGGLGYETDAELLLSMRRLVHDDRLREELGERGYLVRRTEWTERAHLDSYFDLIHALRRSRTRQHAPGVPAPHLVAGVKPSRDAYGATIRPSGTS